MFFLVGWKRARAQRISTFFALAVALLAPVILWSEDRIPRSEVAAEILEELVGIRSSVEYPQEIDRALVAMAQRLAAAGFPAADVEIVRPEPGSAALVARYRSDSGSELGPLLLMAHIDVVVAEPEAWSFDPFTFAEGDGFYYGRGTEDNKTGVATLVANFIRLRREGFVPSRDLIMVLTGDEEVTGAAIGYLMRDRRDLVDAELALNTDAGGGAYDDHGKPRSFLVQTSEKVYQSYRLTATSAGGHSSLPRPGNAIYRLATALTRLAEYDFPIELNDGTRLYFERSAIFAETGQAADMRAVAGNEIDIEAAERLAAASPYLNSMLRTTCVATQLAGGHAENALPRTASAVVNCRVLPGVDPAEVEAKLQHLVADEQITFESLWEATPSPPSAISPEMLTTFEDLVEQMWPGTPVIPRMSAGATDGLYVRNGGIPVLGVAGWFQNPDDVRAHGLDERIGVKEFHQGIEFWYRLLKRLCR